MSSSAAVIFLSVFLGAVGLGLTIFLGYWLQRLAVRHGMRDHHEWVERERALREAYLRGDYDDPA